MPAISPNGPDAEAENIAREARATGKTRTVHVPSTSSIRRCCLLPLAALLASGCMVHTHTVGLGATGSGAQVARQYYCFFGLVRVNEVDAQRLAPELTSYTVETSFGAWDFVLMPLLLPFTATSRTVVVRT